MSSAIRTHPAFFLITDKQRPAAKPPAAALDSRADLACARRAAAAQPERTARLGRWDNA
jgi:hypothetical protein